MIDRPRQLFKSERILITPLAAEALENARASAEDFLQRHFFGDWGEIDSDDAEANENALVSGDRILSAYVLDTGTRLWVLTEAAQQKGTRLTTTILLPTEY